MSRFWAPYKRVWIKYYHSSPLPPNKPPLVISLLGNNNTSSSQCGNPSSNAPPPCLPTAAPPPPLPPSRAAATVPDVPTQVMATTSLVSHSDLLAGCLGFTPSTLTIPTTFLVSIQYPWHPTCLSRTHVLPRDSKWVMSYTFVQQVESVFVVLVWRDVFSSHLYSEWKCDQGVVYCPVWTSVDCIFLLWIHQVWCVRVVGM